MVTSIEGTVESITFRNEINGWTTGALRYCSGSGRSNRSTLARIVGHFHSIKVGEFLHLEGDFDYSQKYGKQFMVRKHRKALPTDKATIRRLLSGGVFHGIGPHIADKLVNTFGKNTLTVLERKSPILLDVPGIGKGKAELLWSTMSTYMGRMDIIGWLVDSGFSAYMVERIANQFPDDSVNKLRENPYLLINIRGIGFRRADAFARFVGIDKDSVRRIAAGFLYCLEDDNAGHTYMSREDLVAVTESILDIDLQMDEDRIEKTIKYLSDANHIVTSVYGIHLTDLYMAELEIANKLIDLLLFNEQQGNDNLTVKDIDKYVSDYESKMGVVFNRDQRKAVRRALLSGTSIITGQPGTGKTTVVGAIIHVYKKMGQRLLLCAPTGRAAKRMTEATGMEAKTIHRLLEFSPSGEGMFKRNAKNPLETDVVILDESSMVTCRLMRSLLSAMTYDMKLVIIGDPDQLPSIGMGNVLNDMLESSFIPYTKLVELYRQGRKSLIVRNAQRVNTGDPQLDKGGRDKDFIWTETLNMRVIKKTIMDFIPTHYNTGPDNIFVVSPLRKDLGQFNATNLNRVLQDLINPGGKLIPSSRVQFRVGDRVMQIVNDYDKNVFNGDIGRITSVEKGSTMDKGYFNVAYDSQVVLYDLKDVDQLRLAYGSSVHKVQGSEFDAIIIVMPDEWAAMRLMSRNLLYTALTRGKKICILMAPRKVVTRAVQNNTVKERKTLLATRLEEAFRKKRNKVYDSCNISAG